MPCYNCETTLERAVNSVVTQDGWHELIMINDASIDNTFKLMQKLSKLDSRIQIHNLENNSGAALARNIASNYATGNILGFLDADDEHAPNTYKLAQEFLQGLPQIAALRFGTKFAGFPSDLLTPEYQNKIQTLLNTFIPNMFIRKVVFDMLGGFPNHEVLRKQGGEDGVLSYLLQKLFLVGTNYENECLIHHWHQGVHAEKFLRTNIEQDNKHLEVVEVSHMLINQKLEELNIVINQVQNRQNIGFITVYKNIIHNA
jgi:glycosyltransferase involved in cell wall biosynthesis